MSASIVLLPNWIGDMLLALSVLMRLPEERRLETTLLVPKQMGGLVSQLCDFPQIAFNRATKSEQQHTLYTVRRHNFSTIYLLPYSFSSAWFAMKTGIRLRRGLAREMRGFLLSQPLSSKLRNKTRHITYEYAEILNIPYYAPETWEGKAVQADNKYANSIVYCPGAAYGAAKRWPHFPELARLQQQHQIVVLGAESDKKSATEIVKASLNNVIDLTGKTSLSTAATIMAGARAVVSNDSGLMHLAGYLGVPVIGIFGSTSAVWTRPLGKQSVVVTSAEPCSPCFKRTCRYDHYNCLRNISAKQIFEAIEQFR